MTAKSTHPPVRPHALVPDGQPSHRGVQGCLSCPLPGDRVDVHITPDVPAGAALIDARTLGESLDGDQ